ncbi:MAG: adenosylmethionine--8-amino-7-oxononanoate transaminase [Epsilonproteobacteria bacterium]|nr:adenosylmethionine--8-amino-7-oxononanoate transaminase [Campylobacterota bacterium]
MTNLELFEQDLKYIWHPCTQMKDHEFLPLIPIKEAKGVYLYDFDNNQYIDAISSWWVNIFGHNNSYINQKIKEQLDKLEHIIFAGFTHKPAIDLAQRLIDITAASLQKLFFADNGSSAIEVSLKMSYHYFLNKGVKKSLFLSLTNSYHGETIGALSVGDVDLYKKTYKPLLINNIQTPVPKDKTIEAANEALEALENILKKEHKNIAAFIVEPLIQGAGNMHMYHPFYLKGARELTKKYGVHLILDEIMTGFGRTGTMFAYEQAEIEPDFLCLSKGLTAGYLPLSVVLTTNEVYSAFYCDYNEHKAFLHSHSYTGNPLACSAALASLDLFEKESIIEKNRTTASYMAKELKRFEELDRVENIRQTGMVAAFDIKGYEPSKRIGLKVYQYGLKNGVLLRPLGNTIYFMPPYVITKEELEYIFKVAYEAIEQLPAN